MEICRDMFRRFVRDFLKEVGESSIRVQNYILIGRKKTHIIINDLILQYYKHHCFLPLNRGL